MPHLYNHPSHHRVGACWRLRAAREEETMATLTTSNSFCCHHRSVMADTGCRRPRHTRSAPLFCHQFRLGSQEYGQWKTAASSSWSLLGIG
uniref:Uncharacterized protein n=1 Tax=Triticum urartu TaxID=4572 RepID=A0A8R7UTP9_TRIUA